VSEGRGVGDAGARVLVEVGEWGTEDVGSVGAGMPVGVGTVSGAAEQPHTRADKIRRIEIRVSDIRFPFLQPLFKVISMKSSASSIST